MLRLPLLLVVLTAAAGPPLVGAGRGKSRTPFSLWGPSTVEPPKDFHRSQPEAPPAGGLGRLGRLAALLGGLKRPATPSCQPGAQWNTECGICVCTPDGEARCVGDDCTFLSDQGGDGSMLDLDMGDDMDLQALSSERHVIVLFP